MARVVVYRKMAGHWTFRVDDGTRRAASAALANYRNRAIAVLSDGGVTVEGGVLVRPVRGLQLVAGECTLSTVLK
jgi:hypothetical protein